MGVSIQPCDLHEITNCSVCTGLDGKLAKEDAPIDLATLGLAPFGYFWAQWPGECVGCGISFDRGDPIAPAPAKDGFHGKDCC